jgi:hypothetical protein
MRTPALMGLLLLAVSVVLPQNKVGQFSGEIMDSQCAKMGGHDRMMKGLNAKDARDCSMKCIGLGGKYVLYDPTTKMTYQVDDQQKSGMYAGQRVSIKGSFDASNKTIHVESIESR